MDVLDDAVVATGNLKQGHNCFRSGRFEEAAWNYQQTLRLDPFHPLAMFWLAQSLVDLQQDATETFTKAVYLLRRAITRQTTATAEAYTCLAGALSSLGRPEEAIGILEEIIAIWPLCLQADTLLAGLLLLVGRYREGFRRFENRLMVPHLTRAGRIAPRWSGGRLDGKTIILMQEQGHGDVIQFSRFISHIHERGGRVLLRTGPTNRLLSLIDGVDGVIADDEPLPDFDVCASVLSLPAILGASIETIPSSPYLRGDPRRWASFLRSLSGRLKVGLCWAGMSRQEPWLAAADRRRSMALTTMAPVLNVLGCSFVSLQLGPPADQLERIPAGRVCDVSGRLLDWQDTADLVAGLDLVIAVDTAVAHLAGALGKPVWLLNRHDSCWRWMRDRTDSPWYPTMRIYRQQKQGDWAPVIEAVAADLKELAYVR